MDVTYPIPGEIFEGRYRIERVLGEGGFARVYLAQQTNLDRYVAIKVLSPGDGQETWRARFEREAQVISRFKSANTVMMYDFGRTAEGLSFMVMEFVSGKELSEVLNIRGSLTPSESVEVLRQVLESLREAHALGVVHRDIKPQNLLMYEHLGQSNQIKVLDFGIARLIEHDPTGRNQLTADQNVVGTPSYMAPEQVAGATVYPATDLYSAGLVAYEMLTGVRAADGENTVATMAMHISDEPILLPGDLDVPICLRSIVETMIEKDLELRYQTADQILRDLQHWQTQKIPTKQMSPPLVHRTETLSKNAGAQEVTSQVRLIGMLLASIAAVAILATLLIMMTDMMKKPEPVDNAGVQAVIKTEVEETVESNEKKEIEQVVATEEAEPEPVEEVQVVETEPSPPKTKRAKRKKKTLVAEKKPVKQKAAVISISKPSEEKEPLTEESKKPVEKKPLKKQPVKKDPPKKKKKVEIPVTF